MAWYEIVIALVAGFGGISGFISLYTAKVKRDGLMTDNMKKIVDEAQEERDSLRKMHNEYVADTDKRMKGLEEKVDKLEKRDVIHQRTINAAWRCRFPEKIEDCPVLKTLNKECDKNEGVCKIN